MSTFNNLKKSLREKIGLSVVNKKNQEEEANSSSTHKPSKISYQDWGFKRASNLNGSHTGLLACLALIRQDHKAMVQKDTTRQNKLKEPLLAELKTNEYLKEEKEEKIRKIEQNIIPDKKEKITRLRNEINEIRKNPSIVMPDRLSKVGFAIGLIILISLTIYLLIFYSSASYSAFFKKFKLDELGLASSIFDPQAIPTAYSDSITELILIISMPFVFLGLGFLIHQFQKAKGIKKYFQIASLIAVTFVFDAILAYEITEKIYNIKAENSFSAMAPYSIDFALHSVNFWLIIFAGFVVYLIWGFVFDFTIEAYDKIDVIKQEIKARERDIRYSEDEIKLQKIKVGKLYDEISIIKEKIIDLNGKINGVIIDTTEFDKILHEFLGGWLHWMNANMIDPIKIDEAKKKADEFIAENIRHIQINNLIE